MILRYKTNISKLQSLDVVYHNSMVGFRAKCSFLLTTGEIIVVSIIVV